MTTKKSSETRTQKAAGPAPATKGKARRGGEDPTLATAPEAPPAEDGLEGALRALELALDKKALEPILLDVRALCSFCNYQLVVSGRSDRQVDAIADGINAGLKAEGLRALGSEGARTGQWALLDYGDFVVHVFLHAAREHYDLEGLWSDAPRVAIDVPADARIPADEAYESAASYAE